jgi:hypothetical protein
MEFGMKLAKWIIAGAVSYISTMWISNFVLNLIASLIMWYVTLYFLNRFLE